jgi:UDPglucose--hexose-1-phosphate uridylyltransferase
MLPTLDPKKSNGEEFRRKERSKENGTTRSGNSGRRHVAAISTPSWKVRVVPNKYPALKPLPDDVLIAGVNLQSSCLLTATLEETDAPQNLKNLQLNDNVTKTGNSHTRPTEAYAPISAAAKCVEPGISPANDLFLSGNFHGAHEVFVECGEHKTSLTQLPSDHVQLVLQSYATRLRHWRSMNSFRYGVVFKNSGAAAGATLSHLHSQLMVTSFLPREILGLQNRWQEYSLKHQSCPVCDLLQRELVDGSRLVWESENFVALTPYASRSPYFISIFPRQHQTTFEARLELYQAELASHLLRTIKALENALSNASYNYVIHTSPFTDENVNRYHWRIDLFPRLGKLAGFEWASGSHINSILPEEAARTLRLYFATSSLE